MNYIIVFLISMSPLVELRGSIPLGIFYYKMSLGEAVFISLAGNILAIYLFLLILNHVLSFFIQRITWIKKITDRIFSFTRKKHEKKFERWKELALVLIVSIPLPLTGACSGTIASYVFGIPPKKAFPLITLGVLIAGLIVTVLTLNGVYIFQ